MKNATLNGGMPRRSFIGRFVEINRNKIVEVISALFILLFLYTAISKSFQLDTTINVIKRAPYGSRYADSLAWLVVVIEYAVVILLFLPSTNKIGLYSSITLMLAFTVYIGYMKLFIPKLPCSCGGVISKMTWNQHLVFNLLFTILALIGVILLRDQGKQVINSSPTTPVVFT